MPLPSKFHNPSSTTRSRSGATCTRIPNSASKRFAPLGSSRSACAQLGYEVHEGIAKTGVVGILRGTRPGKTVMLRADMDALPLPEETASEYASTVAGTMHACGHDGHVAILLAAAELIAQRRTELAGTIVLCFQPAEEGQGGARAMVAEGMLERFGVERAYGLHLYSQLPTGTLGFREGPFYASSDSIEITINGFGGHGAAPHLSIDPILVAAEFVASVQKVVEPLHRSARARRRHDRLDPRRHHPQRHPDAASNSCSAPYALSTPTCASGWPTASSAFCAASAKARARATNSSTCGVTRSPQTTSSKPPTLRALAEADLGPDHVVQSAKHMGAEDFSFFAERVPACYFVLGSASDERTRYPHHHGKFDIDEAALENGVRMMLALALDAPEHAP